MRRVRYIVIGLASLYTFYFAGKEIMRQAKISNAIAILSEGYVYVSVPDNDFEKHGIEYFESDEYQKHLACAEAFLFFNRIVTDRRVRKEMYSPSPSMRVYAYIANLARIRSADIEYLFSQLKLRNEVEFTDAIEYRLGRRCFASDVMLFFASGHAEAIAYGLLDPNRNDDYSLSRPQAEALLDVLINQEPIDIAFNQEILNALKKIEDAP